MWNPFKWKRKQEESVKEMASTPPKPVKPKSPLNKKAAETMRLEHKRFEHNKKRRQIARSSRQRNYGT